MLSSSILPNSGWGTFTQQLADALRALDRFDVTVWIPNSEPPELKSNHTENVLPSWHARAFDARAWMSYAKLFHRLKAFDLIHCVVEFPYALLASCAESCHGVPYLVTAHGTYSTRPLDDVIGGRWYAAALRNARLVTAPSHYTAGQLRERLGSKLRINVIPNAVEHRRFGPAEQRHRPAHLPQIKQSDTLVLSVGALKPRKGVKVLINAFSMVVRQEPSTRLAIVGEGPEYEELQSQITMLGLKRHVFLLGSLPWPELLWLYSECDVFTLLPLVDKGAYEGFGLVYLEAGVSGKPSVAARSGGTADAVVDGKTGILVPENDPESAARALLKLVRETETREAMGRNAREYAFSLSWESYASTIARCYEGIVDGRI